MPDKLLTLDYLQTRLNQAQRDVEMLCLMIQEVEKLVEGKKKSDSKAKFLSVVVSGSEDNGPRAV